MKTSVKAKSLAKQIIVSSTTNGTVDEEKLTKFVQILTQSDKQLSVQILSELRKNLAVKDRQKKLIVESAFPLDPETVESLKQRFEKKTNLKLELEEKTNKSLIAGIKVQYGDDVWENSVLSYLESLKGKNRK